HKLKLVVKGGLQGLPVTVRSYDIDDSTSETFDKDYITEQPIIDTNGAAGGDNLADYLNTPQAGQFWENNAWGDETAEKLFDAGGKAEFHFRVGMQPGSNYRVVASASSGAEFS